MKALHLIPDLDYGNAAKQLSLLVPALAGLGAQSRICVLSGSGSFARALSHQNVDFLNWNRWVDARPFWRLHQILKSYDPDLVHCWRLESMRALALTRWKKKSPVILSNCSWPQVTDINGVQNRVDEWLLRRADHVVTQWDSETELWKQRGVSPVKIVEISPAVESFDTSAMPENLPNLAAGARAILCVGPFEPNKGLKEAIWAFHILGYLLSDVHLILVGEGTDRARMNRLAGKLFPQRVLYTGVVKDYRDILARVEVVWVPSLVPRGFNVALEAMAAGKAVIASRLPGLMEIIEDSETGFLAPVGDKVSVARQTRVLLEDPTRCREMGEAGRRRALDRFSVTTMAESYLRLYNSLAGSRLFQLPK